ncbi:biotinidase [Haematobia irritans]|uniref:biotinidase n=1 Tax=Haematobia irritans TaxID=7368 RepID=UPI003F4FC172
MAGYILNSIFIVCVIGSFIINSYQISLPSDPTYNAGVVEFIPAKEGSAKARLKDNLSRMKAIIESDGTYDLDILVFPEFVLNDHDMMTYVPDPKEKISPCAMANYDWFLTELSCSARSRKLYVVINVVEKVKCWPTDGSCTNGLKTYNTNVVFDREGRVISRYRKTHLYRYEWRSTNVMENPDLATFTTDFGVTFGHFICFDMLFYEPAQILVEKMNITDIIYPTYWFSELPFLTAVQLQEGWAYANNVNLLAADGSYPQEQNTGSGIYAGRFGRLTAVIHEEPTTKLLIAKVPKRNVRQIQQNPVTFKPLFEPKVETPRFTKLSLLRDYNVDIFSTKLLNDTLTRFNETICHNNFCCNFNIERTKIQDLPAHQNYQYRVAAYSGNQTTFQRIDNSNQSVCALIACTGAELYTCGHIFPESVRVGNKYYFNSIKIVGNFVEAKRRLIMPSTVDGLMMPLTIDSYTWLEEKRNGSTRVEINLTTPQQNLLTFGIWANYYSTIKNSHNLDTAMMMAQPPMLALNTTTNAVTSVSASFLVNVLPAVVLAFLLKY